GRSSILSLASPGMRGHSPGKYRQDLGETMRLGLLLTSATLGLLAGVVPVGASELDDLRAQIQALQDRLSAMEAREHRRTAPAAAVEAGSKPKSWKLPGTQTSMNIGGFTILQFDYDMN